MSTAPRTVDEALAWAQGQHDHPTQSWHGLCQMFVHDAYGIGGGFGSAYAQWVGLDDADRHTGGNSADAPVGAALFYKGTNPYGHVMLAAHKGGAWSNDLTRDGFIDFAARTDPETKWSQKYLGWGSSLNGVGLPLDAKKPPAPIEPTHRYAALRKAVDRLNSASDRAAHFGDKALAKTLHREAEILTKLYREAEHK